MSKFTRSRKFQYIFWRISFVLKSHTLTPAGCRVDRNMQHCRPMFNKINLLSVTVITNYKYNGMHSIQMINQTASWNSSPLRHHQSPTPRTNTVHLWISRRRIS